MTSLAKKTIWLVLLLAGPVFAQQPDAQTKPSSGELINKSWSVHGKRDIEATFKYTQECIDLYKDEADKQEATLSALPKSKDEVDAVSVLNDVATAYFIQAESYMRQEKNDDAKKILGRIILRILSKVLAVSLITSILDFTEGSKSAFFITVSPAAFFS